MADAYQSFFELAQRAESNSLSIYSLDVIHYLLFEPGILAKKLGLVVDSEAGFSGTLLGICAGTIVQSDKWPDTCRERFIITEIEHRSNFFDAANIATLSGSKRLPLNAFMVLGLTSTIILYMSLVFLVLSSFVVRFASGLAPHAVMKYFDVGRAKENSITIVSLFGSAIVSMLYCIISRL